MIDLELPLKKRTKKYRFFEMLPAFLSYGSLVLLVVLSLVSPLAAAVYLLLVVITLLIKTLGAAVHTITGRNRMNAAQLIDWHARLRQLENPIASYAHEKNVHSKGLGFEEHKENLRLLSASPDSFPKPSLIHNAVIIAAYNESYEVIDPTIQSLVEGTYDAKRIILVLAFEARGGAAIKETVAQLKKKYEHAFYAFETVEHPAGLPDEVIGKGGNITYAGVFLKKWLESNGIAFSDVIVTTLDSDNRPHPGYLDYVTYEYIVHEDRKHLSYQPIALFTNNIWDVPAPMRVVATGNTFWNIVSSMRPHTLRNFAAHSQPMDALVEMNFWSKRSIVEDGHQYWRSYFYFGGNYSVIPIYIPIYQDAVLSDTYKKTLKAQFTQMRRWAYGASDIPYVAVRLFSKDRNVPLGPGLARFFRLVDSHVTWASVALLVAIGGWVPLLINSQAARDIAAHQLPEVIGSIQRVAMIGLVITIFFSLKMLPPRPERYRRRRTVWMVLQWFLMPVTSIIYSASSAFNAQTHLMLGKYLDKFDVTEKATHQSVARAKQAKAGQVDASSK
jgi:cellulose synthase/poly-beta-1,6-N-acetylglucosamine synthase-like glycosyltransferase